LVIVPKQVQVKGVKKTFFSVEGARDLPALNMVLRTMMVRRTKNEVLDLPPKVRTKPKLTFDDDAAIRRVYTAMKDFAVLRLSELGDDVNIFDPVARGAVQAAMRCEQIAQGFVGGIPDALMESLTPTLSKNAVKIPGRPHELMFPRHPKIVWLLETIKTLMLTNNRVVVYARFLGPLFWLKNLGAMPLMIHGGLSAREKADQIDTFRNGAPSAMGCQVTIAEGFNLTECQDVIFLGRDWSPAVNLQAEDRCHRIGTQGTVNIQVPIVLKTIETMIDKRLAAKEANAAQALKTVTVAELREVL
jgi:SNF2 family DNA or RNA helicase